jgi:hypothetical protein
MTRTDSGVDRRTDVARRLRPRLTVSRLATGAAACLVSLLGACTGGSDVTTAPELSIRAPNTSLSVNESVQLSAVNARGTIAWTSSNIAVATVVSTGFVTAVGPGEARITAATPSQSASVDITVLQPPAIGVDATTIAFTARAGGPNPASQAIAISNTGQGTLSGVQVGSITYGAGQPTQWLSASLGTTSAPTTLTLQAAVSSLSPGVYTATVPLLATTASNSPRTITVTFTVTAPPTIEVSTTSAMFTAVAGAPASGPVAVQLTSGGDAPATGLATTVTYGAGGTGWLSRTLSGTSTPATLSLSASAAGLDIGTYSATVTITSPDASNSPRTLQVTLIVTAPPRIAVSRADASFAATVGGANPVAQTLQVSNAGGGSLSGLSTTVEYASGGGWLSATLNQSTAPATLTLAATTASLTAGTYTATVRVASVAAANSPVSIAVTFTVSSGALIEVAPTSLQFAGAQGTLPPSQAVTVSNAGGGSLIGLVASVEYQSGSGWLGVTPSGGTAPATLTVRPVANTLAPGVYTATLRVAASGAANSPVQIPITYTVTGSTQMVLSATTRTFNMVFGEANPPTQNVLVNKSGTGTLGGLATSITYGTGSGWLSAILSGPTAPSSIAITATRGALPVGSYAATVTVTSPDASNSPQSIDVTFNVLAPPAIGLSTSSVQLSRVSGGGQTGATAVNISNTGDGTLSGLSASIIYTGGPSGNTTWLSATLGSSFAPTSVNISANAGTSGSPLEPGTYTAVVRIASAVASNSPRDIAVQFDVPVSFTNNIFAQLYGPYCSACHFSGGSQPNLSTVSAFRANMINVQTTNRSGYPLATTHSRRIVPGSASTSYLTYQLQKSSGAYPMPTGASTVPLSLRTLISTWINQGANNN